MTLKIAALAPMPMARVSTATMVNPGIRARLRKTWFRRMAIHTNRADQGSASGQILEPPQPEALVRVDPAGVVTTFVDELQRWRERKGRALHVERTPLAGGDVGIRPLVQ